MTLNPTATRRLRLASGLAIFGVLTAGLVVGFLSAFAPKPRPARVAPYEGHDQGPMDAAMAPDRVAAEMEAILACGSRFPGQEGLRAAQHRTREAFAAAGLEVLELSQTMVAPRTLRRAIRDDAGRPLAGVEIYPFLPNHFQPTVTPEGGLTGTLVLATDDMLRTRMTFDDAVALIDVDDPPASYGLSWIPYAQAGFRAVILAHREGLERVGWEPVGSFRASTPVNYPRLAATAGIFAHVGERVTLDVRVEWAEAEHPTLVGILPSPAGRRAREAVIVPVCVDACAVLPDLAPGTLGALNVAAQRALLDGVRVYRDDPHRTRDVIFVSYASQVMGHLAADRLTAAIGPAFDRELAALRLRDERQANDEQAARIEACRRCFDDAAFGAEQSPTAARLEALERGAAATFNEELRFVLNTVVLELSEVQLQARLAFLRGGEDAASEAFVSYRAAKNRYDAALASAGFPLWKLLATAEKRALMAEHGVRGRLRARFDELAAFHARRRAEIEQAAALYERFAGYAQVIAVEPFLAPADPAKGGGEAFSFFMGRGVEDLGGRQSPVIQDVLVSVAQRAALPEGVTAAPYRGRDHGNWASRQLGGVPVGVAHWNAKGYPAFAFISPGRAYAYGQLGVPVDAPWMHDLGSLRHALRVLGRTVLTLAYGYGTFEPPVKSPLASYGGRVYVSNVGRSIVPNYPLPRALLGHKGPAGAYEAPGYYANPFLMADAYGRYSLPLASLSLVPAHWGNYSPEAVGMGPDGLIRFAKDEGPQGQRVYKSMNLGWGAGRDNVNIVTFRSSPVTLFDVVNPQSLTAYTGFGFLQREGLAGVGKHNVFAAANGIVTAFLEPDRRFFLSLKAGSPDNEKVQTERAFALGVDGRFAPSMDKEIDGRGYLAADTPYLRDVPLEVARSMLLVNGRRLDLQTRYGMADARTRGFHARSRDLVEGSLAAGKPKLDADIARRAAVTYATLNHPVLRRSIFEAVVGILWYLGLLVPFVFFFEKLVFGYADIRRQLAAQAAIFLVVFLLLRWIHPAFAMIRSSLMILLGFVIMLISGGIAVLFAGRFQENLEDARRKRGQVTAAEVNTFGVLGTAFALGLNNMHRRIVRTGLTCATLVLLTFAMICFTSAQSDIVNTASAVGKAPYQGLLVKRERLLPMGDAELFALKTRYGHRYTLAPRRMVVGIQGWDRILYNPDIELAYEPAGGTPKQRPVASLLELGPTEPLRDRLRLLTRGGWFTEDLVKAQRECPPVLIPEPLAAELGIAPADVDRGEVRAKINGKPVRVHGIFDPASLAELRDLDGRGLLPFDIEAMRTVQVVGGSVLADDSDPRLSADRIAIVPEDLGVAFAHGQNRLVSVAVCMPGLAYKQARAEIDQYLEQSGQTAYYGLDEVSYRGRRARERTFAGMVELIVPLLIAAMTVLNTMRGSVYERRDEIFVYNAVGIAPRYIFAMFFSEAFVYAVVGSVLGFLLSQSMGMALTALGWTGGLNMTFTTMTTIHASLAIMAAVFLSTLFPARSAMAIAAPAEDAGWRLPEPDGDRMTFSLPFTFNARDRIAVLAFFRRYFEDHGEGGAGRFFADPPALGVADAGDPLAGDGYVPQVSTTIWLKPFDLGVSQALRIEMPTDPETREFLARVTLTRLSGTRESWVRLNEAFVGLLRRHFLYWRAVSPDERRRLFDEARGGLEA